MSDIVRVTKNDYGINLTYTVRDSNGAPLDISTSTSRILHIGRRGETANLVDGSMTFVNTGADGQVKYTIITSVLSIAGYYDAEIEIVYAAGRRTTRPFTLQIIEEL